MSPTRMVKIESASRLALDLNKAFNLHDVDGMSKLISDNCILEDHGPSPDGAVYSGKDAIARYWREQFSDALWIHMDIEDVFGMGNRCVMRWRRELTDRDGRDLHRRGVDLYEVRSDAIFRIWSYVKG